MFPLLRLLFYLSSSTLRDEWPVDDDGVRDEADNEWIGDDDGGWGGQCPDNIERAMTRRAGRARGTGRTNGGGTDRPFSLSTAVEAGTTWCTILYTHFRIHIFVHRLCVRWDWWSVESFGRGRGKTWSTLNFGFDGDANERGTILREYILRFGGLVYLVGTQLKRIHGMVCGVGGNNAWSVIRDGELVNTYEGRRKSKMRFMEEVIEEECVNWAQRGVGDKLKTGDCRCWTCSGCKEMV